MLRYRVPLIVATLLIALAWMPHNHNPSIVGSTQNNNSRLLSALPCQGTCDLHFVADDWSGSGDWAARSGGWTAVKTGTPTRSLSATFTGRHYVSGWTASDYFKIAANAAHNATASGDGSQITYEFVIEDLPTVAGFTAWYGNIHTSAAYGGWFFYLTTSTRFDIEIGNTSADPYLGGLSAAAAYTAGKPHLVTETVDIAAHTLKVYINGSLLTSGALPYTAAGNGTFTPGSCDIAIGGRWNCNGPNLGDSGAIKIIEIVRHRSVLDATTIASRARSFVALKGY